MALKFRRGTAAQQSGSLVFGEPYINTDLNTLLLGGNGTQIQLLNISGGISASLIPQSTNAFDLGSATNIWRDLYISTGSIKFVAGTTVVKEITLATFTGLESATGSSNVFTASAALRLTNLETTSASVNISVGSLNTFSASENTKSSTLATYTGSVDTKFTSLATYTGSIDTKFTSVAASTASLNSFTSSAAPRLTNLETTSASVNGHIADINSKTGSYARTNSTNTFNGNQIITGSVYITQDLVVLGSSSIQNISSSRLDIGDNIIQLNVNQPALRFGGIAVFDSGSTGGSGSLLYDAVEDEFIFVHRGNGTNVTSSHFITGPETYDNLGNETYLTTNRLPKASGKEHLNDSNITDTGTLITLASNTVVNGTFVASGTSLVSGSAQVVAMLSSLNTYTGSNDTTNTTQNTRLSRIEESTSSLNTLTGSLATTYEGRASATKTLFSGSSQVTLSSTTGYGTVINQNLLTTSDVTHNTITGTIRATNGVVSGSSQIVGSSITTNSITIAGISTALGGTITLATITGGTGIVSGSSQVTLSSTNGYSGVINQNLLTTSDVRHNSLGIGMAASATAGRIDASGDIIAFSTSDINFKENITPIPNALEKISKISGNIYDWKSELKEYHGFEGNDVGVIAQEIEEILPQLVQTRENGYKAVKYDKLVALLIEGIKEQQTQIEKLRMDLDNYECKCDNCKSK